MESKRQLQVARLLQKELGIYFQQHGKTHYQAFITVTSTKVSPDLSYSKVYVSIFMAEDREATLDLIRNNLPILRKNIGYQCGSQLRIVPNFQFFLDESLDYVEHIDSLLKQ